MESPQEIEAGYILSALRKALVDCEILKLGTHYGLVAKAVAAAKLSEKVKNAEGGI